jgi:hypothetical protein
MYRDSDSNEVFINNWLNWLFNDAKEIFETQEDYYNSLELLEYIIKKLSFDKKNQFGISVKVIGFNSKNFDINYITDEKIHIRSIVGTESQYKTLTLEHDNFPFKLQFLDLKSFLEEEDLDKYSIKFADKLDSKLETKKQKGVFPYEF